MNQSKAFLFLLERLPLPKIVFSDHFQVRKESRGIGEGVVEDFLLNRQKDLLYAIETTNRFGLLRYKAFYAYSKRKTLLMVLDVEKDGSLRIVTVLLIEKRLQLGAMRNADRYAKLAGRL